MNNGQQVGFCEYADDDEIPKGCASKSRDRLDQRMNPDVDVEEDNSDSDDGSSSSHGSASDEEILRELGLSELNLDDDNNESDYVNATKTIENLRSFEYYGNCFHYGRHRRQLSWCLVSQSQSRSGWE